MKTEDYITSIYYSVVGGTYIAPCRDCALALMADPPFSVVRLTGNHLQSLWSSQLYHLGLLAFHGTPPPKDHAVVCQSRMKPPSTTVFSSYLTHEAAELSSANSPRVE